MVGRRSMLAGGMALAALPVRGAWGQETAIRVPITLGESRVIVPCSLAGQGPFGFVLDTGGTIGLLDMPMVRQLGLKSLGKSVLSIHARRASYAIFEARDLVFGGVVRQPVAAFAGVDNVRFGEGAVGSLAAGTLSAVNGELDYDAAEWRIYRGDVPARPGWTRYDKAIVKAGNMNGSAFLFADAALNGQPFRFGLDTGMPSAIRIYRKTAERAGLWDAAQDGGRWSPAAPEGKGRIVRATALDVAGVRIERPLVSIIADPQWEVFDAGLLGLPMLRLYNMATESAAGAVLLKRNRQPRQDESYNRAGIWVDRRGKVLSIGVVGPGSAADVAGLAAGDAIIGADFHDLIGRFAGPAGSRIAMTVERAGKRREVELVLTDYL